MRDRSTSVEKIWENRQKQDRLQTIIALNKTGKFRSRILETT